MFTLKFKKNMRTRPVFESFNDFVYSLNNSINEAEESGQDPFTKFMIDFGDSGVPAKEAFDAANQVLLLSPRISPGDYEAISSHIFAHKQLQSAGRLQRLLTGGTKSDSDVKLGTVEVEKKSIKYNSIINGKVLLKKYRKIGDYTKDRYTGSIVDGETIGDDASRVYVDLYDLFTAANVDNLSNGIFGSLPSITTEEKGKEKGKSKWSSYEGMVDYTGIKDQNLITSVDGGFTLEDKSPLESLKTSKLDKNPSTDKTVYQSFVLYGIENYLPMDPNNQNTIPNTYIKKELVEVSGPSQEYTAPVDCGPNIFPQNETTFTSGKDKEIDMALTNALAPLLGLPTKITILGGASYETNKDDPNKGGPESKINQALVDGRAEVVAERYRKMYPTIATKITAKKGDYSKIQATDDSSKYEQFRKVYVIVEGVIAGDKKTIENTFIEKTSIPAGSATIVEYVISFPFTSPKIS